MDHLSPILSARCKVTTMTTATQVGLSLDAEPRPLMQHQLYLLYLLTWGLADRPG